MSHVIIFYYYNRYRRCLFCFDKTPEITITIKKRIFLSTLTVIFAVAVVGGNVVVFEYRTCRSRFNPAAADEGDGPPEPCTRSTAGAFTRRGIESDPRQ